MGQGQVQVVLSNYRETVMARLRHVPASDVHRLARLSEKGPMILS